MFLGERLGWAQIAGIALIVAGALTCLGTSGCASAAFQNQAAAADAAATFTVALSSVLFKFFAIAGQISGPPPSGPSSAKAFGAAVCSCPDCRRQFVALFRRNPGAVLGVNAANELINLGGGLGVRYA